LAGIAARVRPLCEKYDIPYTTGSLGHQYLATLSTIHRLALPDRFLNTAPDDMSKAHPGRQRRPDAAPRLNLVRPGAHPGDEIKGPALESASSACTAPRPAA
jgi:NADPH-dependent stearoyl-CoA 9-desaturase